MPDRIIKESARRSRTLDSLSWFETVCFFYLTVTVDDYGRFYRDPILLKSELFPRKASLPVDEVDEAMKILEEKGLIHSYVWDGEEYLQIVGWSKHQRTRAKRSKFPDECGHYSSGDSEMLTDDSPATADDCHLTADDSNLTADDSNSRTSDVKCQQVADICRQMSPNTNAKANTNTNTNRGHFVPPTLEEVTEFCRERNNGIDPEAFIAYYEARGWELSKGRKVKSWKSCVITWEKNGFSAPKQKRGIPASELLDDEFLKTCV